MSRTGLEFLDPAHSFGHVGHIIWRQVWWRADRSARWRGSTPFTVRGLPFPQNAGSDRASRSTATQVRVSHEMNDSIVRRHSLRSALVWGVQAIVPALITMGALYASVVVSDGVLWDEKFVLLAAVSGALGLVMLQPSRYTSTNILVDRASVALGAMARWAALLAILFAIGYVTKSSGHYSRQAVLTWAVVTPVLLVITELLFMQVLRHLEGASAETRKAVFAGCNEVSLALAQRMIENRETRIEPVGFFDDRSADRLGYSNLDIPIRGRLPELAAFVKEQGIDMIFVALPMRHLQRVIDLLDDLRDTTASIYYVPDIFVYDLIQARTGEVAGIPVVAMCETPFFGFRGVVKRLTDIFVAGAALLGALPLLLLIALLVKLTSRGPVIFRQKRYGLDGEQITVYKFRSMTVTEDGAHVEQARRGDHRLTPIGGFLRRTSLDELPQLINVVQGRMSLVGPRPHAVVHNEQYRRLIKGYMIRHKVRPGITGLAQVNGCRGETAELEEMQARVRYDLEYLRRWSPGLDLVILWRTLLLLVRREEKAY
jgi:putative colanic acid biosysnthesis UDP-glucose lipid carrier transferase